MKSRMSSAVAFTGLLALVGTSFAAGDPHEPYNRAFWGDQGGPLTLQDRGAMGRIAEDRMDGTAAVSDPHQPYNQAFQGKSGQKLANETTDTMGKAAYGTPSSGIDGNAAYRDAFRGD